MLRKHARTDRILLGSKELKGSKETVPVKPLHCHRQLESYIELQNLTQVPPPGQAPTKHERHTTTTPANERTPVGRTVTPGPMGVR